MASPRRIVVGIDGSPDSQRALEWALHAATLSGDEVDAVLVWCDPWSLTGTTSLGAAGEETILRLRGMLKQVVTAARENEPAPNVTVVQRVLAGNPHEVLVEEGKGSQLLVVGTRGMSGLRKWMLGSVSQRCAQLSDIPVLIVPAVGERQ